MECVFPGRVLVGPGPEAGGAEQLSKRLREEFREDFDYEYSIADIITHNHLDLSPSYSYKLPFVARVPEGAETDIAARMSRLPDLLVAAAIPDYLVRPNGPITIDQPALDDVIGLIHGAPGALSCGRGCVIGIVDSGVDASYVTSGALDPRQYDALQPVSGSALADRYGHGSLVARIINSTAPGAKLISVKAFDSDGTISSIIAGLYLANAAGPCDIINLSLKVSCDPELCKVCQSPVPAAANIAQLSYFFDNFMNVAPDTILVAAAGNNVSHLTLPAAFNRIIAVGSFDYATRSPISDYVHVPADRFVLAPGGQNRPGKAFAERPGYARPELLYGTSFAAAFATAFAAKTVCNRKNSHCGTPLRGRAAQSAGAGLLETALDEIEARSDQTWPGYNRNLHGLGALRF